MTRSCSHCTPGGHTSRSCPNRGVKLFGFRLTADGTPGPIRKSASMGNLTHCESAGFGSKSSGQHCGEAPEHGPAADEGYASEDLVPGPASSCRQRKKGTPWTQEEHRMFLIGLQKLGKGDWRGISRNFVISRTPTQVASHAQKYFIRQTNVSRRRRRSSLFDIVADEPVDTQVLSPELLPAGQPQSEAQNSIPLPTPPVLDEECESMDSSDSNKGHASFLPFPQQNNSPSFYPFVFPTYYSPFLPFPLPLWHEPSKMETHEVLKPTAIHSKNPINVDGLVGLSNLSLENSSADGGPSTLSLKLHGGSARQSAFHASPNSTRSGMNSTNSAIHAV